jgi:hypothetical protein
MLHSSYSSHERESLVQTHQLQITDGRNRVDEIRRELFAFSEVLDVLISPRPDALVVVCSGHPHPAEWQRALRAVGFSFPSRRRPTPRPPARAVQTTEAERALADAPVDRRPPPVKAIPAPSGPGLLLRVVVS